MWEKSVFDCSEENTRKFILLLPGSDKCRDKSEGQKEEDVAGNLM